MSSSTPIAPQKRFSLSRAWSSLESNLRLMIVISVVESFAVNLYASVLMPYFHTLGVESDAVGGFTSIRDIVMVSVGVFAGIVADTFGRKKLFIAGQLCRCVAAGLLLVTRSYIGFIVVFVMRGLASMQGPASSAMFAEYTKKENRSTLLGVSQAISHLAWVLGPIVAGTIADHYGVRYAFAGSFILAVLAVVMAIPLKERREADVADEVKEVEVTEKVSESPLVRVRRMFRESNSWVALTALLTGAFTNGFANGVIGIVLPFTIMDRFSSAYTTIALADSVASLGIVIVLVVGGRIADVHGRRGIVLFANALAPLLTLLTFLSTSFPLFLTMLFLWSMLRDLDGPAMDAAYMEAVVDRDRATFSGFQMSLNCGGAVLGALGAGIGYKISPTFCWMVAVGLFWLQMLLYAIALPRDKKTVAD